ncbi:J domain-containing protein [Leptospira sp. GIMC2001]|uniref:J domain-containing protein n=1 Tax=Leptospira sp. GIMC2001 TaxID=1513297 RepID=UPI00234B48B8|nr:J domain-containing protein [Leptospira sp. GIMC2001]WCL48796.1 DnaJ domain-containing protein [Leptospira sp. GIMC2001]
MNPSEGFPDYYSCLGLRYGASSEEIKKRFRGLAKTFHPDNPATGSKLAFQKLLRAYQVLTSDRDRKIYDYAYASLSFDKDNPIQKEIQKRSVYELPSARVVFSHSLTEYSKIGLMRKGYRMKDRRKWTGINHDVELKILNKEVTQVIRAQIPLTVRVMCPDCMGSDLHCGACGGSGSYKSSRNLIIDLLPKHWQDGQVLELDLGKYRPDKLTYFKKRKLKIKLSVLTV